MVVFGLNNQSLPPSYFHPSLMANKGTLCAKNRLKLFSLQTKPTLYEVILLKKV